MIGPRKLIERYPGKDIMYTKRGKKNHENNWNHMYRWDRLYLKKYKWMDEYLLARKNPEFVPVPEDYDGPVWEGHAWRDLGEDALGLPFLDYNADKATFAEMPNLKPGNLIVYQCHTYNEYTGGRNGIPSKCVIVEIVKNTNHITISDGVLYGLTYTSFVIQSVTKAGKLGKKLEWNDRPRYKNHVKISDNLEDVHDLYIGGAKYKSRKVYSKLWRGFGYADLTNLYSQMRYWFWTKYKQEKERG